MEDNEQKKDKEYFEVLARKYRPKLFSELVGQDILVKSLSNAIKLNRLSHAYLLTGVRGVGKTTTARLIARAINCESISNDKYEPCGKCTSCYSIIKESNMDVIEMDAASRTSVEDIREIIENIKYKPTNSKYKVYIIDEVHMLSKSAFNALLKTLEEPPPHVKFLFATTEVHKLPVTILSRCQRFDLYRIDNEILTKHILNICHKENIEISKEAVALIVRSADGSVRDGLSLLDQAIVNSQGKIDDIVVTQMLGLTDRGKIFELMDLIFQGNAKNGLKLFKSLTSQGADTLMIFEEMLQITHFITEVKILPEVLEDKYTPELERTKGSEMAKNLSMASIGQFWQALFRGYQELKEASNFYQTAEMIIIRLIFLSNTPPPADLIKKIDNNILSEDDKNKVKISSKVNNDHSKTINELENKVENKKINNDIIKKASNFREFVELFHKNREGLLHTQLYNEVKLISFEVGKISINVKDIRNSNFTKEITKLISKWTGRIWTINTSDSNVGKTLAEEDILLKEKLFNEIENDNDVKKILNYFPGSKIFSIENNKKDNDSLNQVDDLKKEEI